MKSPAVKKGCLALVLALATLGLYWKTGHYAFVNIDDDLYVTKNPLLDAGLTPSAAWAALWSLHAGNWHPLTWLSHMVDVSLFGMDAGAHHRVNAALHSLAAALCFLALSSLTRGEERAPTGTSRSRATPPSTLGSLFVAALFALHPLRVESVAWIAERKDLLAGVFWFACLWAYAGYARRPSLGRYTWMAFLLLLSLASKPMAVTLPCVLLLLDYWPLRREVSWTRLLAEKLPLFALVAASIVVTTIAQTEAIVDLEHIAFPQRVGNALHSYVIYLGQIAWPFGLVFFYPHPALIHGGESSASGAAALACGAALIVCSALALAFRRRAPFFWVGWLWYLGTLVPVIGFMQVGAQAHADRYTYLPSVGIFLALVWSVLAWGTTPGRRRVAVALGGTILIACALRTSDQIESWASSRTLTEHALRVSTDNYLARCNLGQALEAEGAIKAARKQYAQADRLWPGQVHLRYNRARVEISAQRWRAAERRYRMLLKRWPDYLPALSDLGVLLSDLGRDREALAPLGKAWNAPAPLHKRVSAGQALVKVFATSAEADLRDGERAVRIARACLEAVESWQHYQGLAVALAERGDYAQAAAAQRSALARVPAGGVASLTGRLHLFENGQPFHRTGVP